jgi:transmembrane sensor
MTDICRLPDSAEIEREASEWIARLEADNVSNEDRARFEAWRSSHALHARIYDELRGTWEEFTAEGPLVRAVSFGQSMIHAGKPKVRGRWALAAAVSAALIVVAGYWYFTGRPAESFQTAIGEHATLTLPDTSVVELNSNTLARVEYTRKSRLIRLERGEAYFKVAHDTERPFWVVADQSWVRAVGTAFNVDMRPSGVRVTVSEGTVKVGSETPQEGPPSDNSGDVVSASTTLTEGEQVDFHGHAVAVRKLKPGDVTRSTGWRTGTLYFENEPLGDVVAELGRYTTLKIVVQGTEIDRVPVGGTFQASAQGAEALVAMLKDGLGLAVRREDGRVYIGAPPAP